MTTAQRAFRRLAIATTTLTYLLVAVGATVRVTGAGMGCPDWPTCFGLWVPPFSVDDLPPLGSYSYPPGWSVETFDPTMTLIEYLNRLFGVLVGMFITATLVAAIVAYRKQRNVLWPTIVAFIGVLYAGWLGARVVAHELAPWIVTVHLMAAIAVVSALVVAVINAGPSAPTPNDGLSVSRTAWLTMALTLVQGGLGTQVRGFLEDTARAQPELTRGQWIEHIGLLDTVHRGFAVVVVVAVAMTALSAVQRLGAHAATRAALIAAGLALSQLVLGGVLVNADLPRAVQVLHLLGSALLLGALTATAMWAKPAPRTIQ